MQNVVPVVAVDVGYGFTKTSSKVIFPSKIATEEPLLGCRRTLYWKNTMYYVGVGEPNIELNRIEEELTKVCLIYGILSSTKPEQTSCRLVTGLPLSQIKSEMPMQLYVMIKEDLKNIDCIFNDQPRRMRVLDVDVYPQCLAAILPYKEDMICVDLGSRTTDILHCARVDGRRKVMYTNSLYDAMMLLYSKITACINEQYNLTLDAELIPNILEKGLIVDGKEVKLDFLADIINAHVQKIATVIKLFLPYKTTKIKLTGGGTTFLGAYFKKVFPQVEYTSDAQWENVLNYKLRGDKLWGSDQNSLLGLSKTNESSH
jgi:plasmid segregation protein ParM